MEGGATMRTGWLLVGVSLGLAGAAYLAQGQAGRAGRTPATTPKQRLQDDEAREALGHMIEDVAHRPDIPETPVKHAFEHAVEG
jgi:hypothetical protein